MAVRQVPRERSDRLVTVATVAVLALTAMVGGWLVYTVFVQPTASAMRLPEGIRDWRGQELPSLEGLVPVGGSSLAQEFEAQTTVIAFLLTTCPACNNARATLEQFAVEGRGSIGVVGIFAESEEAIVNYGALYPSFTDTGRRVFDAFGATTVPMILVAREGRVVSQSVGWSPSVGQSLRESVQ